MKKFVCFILTGIMAFSLAACGSGKVENNNTADKETQTEQVTEQEEAASAEQETSSAEEAESAEQKTQTAEEAANADQETSSAEEAASAEQETSSTEEAKSAGQEAQTAEEAVAAPLLGGWTRAESPVVTDEIRNIIEKATENIDGVTYTPIAYISSQVVAGTNHAVLCALTPVIPDPVPYYAIVTIYEDLQGNAEITGVVESRAEVEAAPGTEGLSGGWTAPESPEVTDEAKAALEKAVEKMTGAEYEPVALLATQVVAGLNYAVFCAVTPVVPNAETGYAVVHVYEDLQGNASVTDVFDFSATE